MFDVIVVELIQESAEKARNIRIFLCATEDENGQHRIEIWYRNEVDWKGRERY
jgi:hypothetical protein